MPKVTDSPSSTSIYRVNSTNGATCTLIRTDGILDIQYRTITNEDVVANTFLPDNVELSGDCSEADISSLTMIFKGFKLYMVFKKTPGGERWYVSNVELEYSSSNPLLKQVDRPGLQVSIQRNGLRTSFCFFFRSIVVNPKFNSINIGEIINTRS